MNKVEQVILQRHLAKYLVDEVFDTITEEDILKVQGKTWTHLGKELTESQVADLKIEADKFSKSKLWEILRSELRWQAHQRLLEKAETENDIVACKLLGYLTDIVDSKLKSMSK